MSAVVAKPITIAVGSDTRVSGLLQVPPGARAGYVLAHGAGAGMTHPFMTAVAAELARARHRHASLPVSLYGAPQPAAGPAGGGAGDGPRRGGGGATGAAGSFR